MNGEDRRGEPEWPIDRGQDGRVAGRVDLETRRPRIPPILIALVVIFAVLALLWVVAGRGNSDQDKLTGIGNLSSNVAATDPEKSCASKQTYELIKRELFRRAAQVRGSDDAAFGRLSAYAVLRMENPVMESEDAATHAVNCSGSLSLDLPPGVAVVGGRRTLASDVDYTLQPAADGSGNVVLLRNADSIISPLATLGRLNEPGEQQQPAPPTVEPQPDGNGAASGTVEPAPPSPAGSPRAGSSPASDQDHASASAHPSFDCAKAHTKGEIAVCSDSGLAALDRNMAAQYVRAMSAASPEQEAILRRTRDHFLAYRDRCPSRACIGDAYVGRMREIRDILNGSWSPPH
jgi:uncharacterized protein YecT (DUF1311 family)